MHKEKAKLYEKRAEQFHRQLGSEIIMEFIPLSAEFCRSAEPVTFAERSKGEYRQIKEGEKWGDTWDSAWFHIQASVPPHWSGSMVAARLDFNGEALVFSDSGCPLYGLANGSVFDVVYSKDIYRLIDRCVGGETVDFWIEAAANHLFGLDKEADPRLDSPTLHGSREGKVVQLKLCRFDDELWHLRLDVEVLLNLLNGLPEESVRRARILLALGQAADIYGNARAHAPACRARLREMFATPANASDLSVTAVGHAHIDTGWLWPVREGIRKCARTFASQVALLEQYPDYVFGASQAQHYLFVKEHYPELYEKMRKHVKTGRWELQGGTWVECDCNLTSGESLVRQFVHGKNFFRDEFGIDVKNLWLPDVFGYSAAMPQIMRRAGVEFFLTQKLSWSQFNTFPHNTFRWEGIDGSEIVTHFPPENTYNSAMLPGDLIKGQNRFVERDVLDRFISLFGIGDGGGGPKEEHVERALRLGDLEGCPKVGFGRSEQYFEGILSKADLLDKWSGELYLECHRATLTTQARTKKGNRMLENCLRAVEALCACLPAEQYPRTELDRIWKNLLLNQFHDILPGSSIHMVYEQTERDYADGLSRCAELANEAAASLFEKDGNSLVLFNGLSSDYTQPVNLPASWRGHAVADEHGSLLPVQHDAAGAVVLAVLPAHSFTTLRKGAPLEPTSITGTELVLENEHIRYEFSADGEVTRAFDKEVGRDVLAEGGHANRFALYVDRPHNWDAWDIDIFYENQLLSNATGRKAERLCDGAVRQGLRFELDIGESKIRQQVYLCANSKRLDFQTHVDWAERHCMLRVEFPTAIRSSEFTCDIQYGYLKRATHRNSSWDMAKFEVCAHRYVDLSDNDYGVALLNDCKYGHKVLGSVIDLNLLRAPTHPDPVADRGEHEFTYSLLPHGGGLLESTVMQEAAMLNHRPLIFNGVESAGAKLPCTLESEGISLEVIKQAEKEACRVIRLVETHGRISEGVLNVSLPEAVLVETDLLEWTDGAVLDCTQPVKLRLKPFEIRTYKVRT